MEEVACSTWQKAPQNQQNETFRLTKKAQPCSTGVENLIHGSLPVIRHLKQCGGRNSGHRTVHNLDTWQHNFQQLATSSGE